MAKEAEAEVEAEAQTEECAASDGGASSAW